MTDTPCLHCALAQVLNEHPANTTGEAALMALAQVAAELLALAPPEQMRTMMLMHNLAVLSFTQQRLAQMKASSPPDETGREGATLQ